MNQTDRSFLRVALPIIAFVALVNFVTMPALEGFKLGTRFNYFWFPNFVETMP